MDIRHDDKKNTVNALFELPGLQKDDVSIDVNNDILTVSGETKHAAEREEEGYTLRERRWGRFSRSLSLPHGLKVRRNSTPTPTLEMILMYPLERGNQGIHEQWRSECQFPQGCAADGAGKDHYCVILNLNLRSLEGEKRLQSCQLWSL